ncbi:MAG: alkaline phosphatase family protein [Balneolales bacterium]
MITCRFASSIGLFLLLTITGCSGETEKENKSLFIIVDGISADVLEMIDTPNLDAIAREGAYTRGYIGGEAGGYSESPTVSAVGYNHVLTGVWSNKHNVYGNNIETPNYNYWNIFRLLKHNHPDKKVAIFSSWLDNRTKLAGEGLPAAGNLMFDIKYDGFEHDTLAFPHDEAGTYVQKIDQHIAEKASESIKADGPDLSWVYLWYTDSAGHYYGDGDIYYESLQVADKQIGLIRDAVKYREENFNEDWLIVVTTDHGRSLPDGKGHGGHSERERTVWMVTNHSQTNTYFSASSPGVVDIYPTISRFMNLDVPEPLSRELDGVPFIGQVSLSSPSAYLDNESGELHVSWKAWNEEGDVNIWVSRSNSFREGREDPYELLGTAPLMAQEARLDANGLNSGFIKIAIEGPDNTVNRWIVNED